MNKLKEIRIAKKISQTKLAFLVSTSRSQLNRLERGSRKLTKEWAERLSPHLGVTVLELLFPDDSVDYSGEKFSRKNANTAKELADSNQDFIIKVIRLANDLSAKDKNLILHLIEALVADNKNNAA